MDYFNKCKPIIMSILGLLIISAVFLLLNKNNYDIKLDRVIVNEEVNNKHFALMIDTGNGYEEASSFPNSSEYILDEEESGCIDEDGNLLNISISYNPNTHTITYDAMNTSYCYLYFKSFLPAKGNFVHFTDDTAGVYYRVLKTEGTNALVLRMNNDLWYTEYADDLNPDEKDEEPIGETAQFENGSSYIAYSGSLLDTYMNTTIYNSLNTNVKNAIVAQNIYQGAYSWHNEIPSGNYYMKGTGTFPVSDNPWVPSTYTSNNYWIGYVSKVNVGSRYVYALDVEDVREYLGANNLSYANISELFFHSYNSNLYYSVWLRSAGVSESNVVYYASTDYGALEPESFDQARIVRPAFVIDLSNVNFTEVDPSTITSSALGY